MNPTSGKAFWKKVLCKRLDDQTTVEEVGRFICNRIVHKLRHYSVEVVFPRCREQQFLEIKRYVSSAIYPSPLEMLKTRLVREQAGLVFAAQRVLRVFQRKEIWNLSLQVGGPSILQATRAGVPVRTYNLRYVTFSFFLFLSNITPRHASLEKNNMYVRHNVAPEGAPRF